MIFFMIAFNTLISESIMKHFIENNTFGAGELSTSA